MTLTFDKPHRRNDGHIGARATIRVDHDGGLSQHYSFDTHGMTSSDVTAEVARIEAYHTAKANRLLGFRQISGSELVKDGQTFVIVDCAIFDAGVTLYIDVRPRAKGFPIRRAFHRIEDVPSDGEIVGIVIEALPESSAVIDSAHAEFVAKVESKMVERG